MNNPIYIDTGDTVKERVVEKTAKPKLFSKAPVKNIKSSFSSLQKFWMENMAFMKDHLPIPPRPGLVWDQIKHRWTRPEKAGLTVAEVQGGKRFRGVGTGAAQGAVSRKRGLERGISLRRGREASARRRGKVS